jgi:glycosyltransferase involved in cell wall biosynthesis
MKILLVSLMYPGPEDPDLGAFLVPLVRALEERGHQLERAVLRSRAGGKRRYLELLRRARAAAHRTKPDVVYAHFLVPTGLIGMLASRAPLVVTAHGQDVANIGEVAGIGLATRLVVRRATAVVAVSHYLRRRLEAGVPDALGKVKVVDCGVDLGHFHDLGAEEAAARVGWPPERPAYLCVGSLSERKNVARLAAAFERLGGGSLAFVGDGPLRGGLEGRPGITVAGRISQEDLPAWMSAADVVCQPSLIEPFGQATLEAMACSRSVVATLAGGPPEFVPPGAGVLVDPLDEAALSRALEEAARLSRPNRVARAAAAQHDVRRQAAAVEEILAGAVHVHSR